MIDGYVLSLCDRTGNMVKPWIEAGCRAVTVDLQQASVSMSGRTHIACDVRELVPAVLGRPSIVFAFPPCTHLASSGARWFKGKGMAMLIEALQIVEACRALCEELDAPYMIENPVGTLATYWRDPDHTFHPVHFAAMRRTRRRTDTPRKRVSGRVTASSCRSGSQASRHLAA